MLSVAGRGGRKPAAVARARHATENPSDFGSRSMPRTVGDGCGSCPASRQRNRGCWPTRPQIVDMERLRASSEVSQIGVTSCRSVVAAQEPVGLIDLVGPPCLPGSPCSGLLLSCRPLLLALFLAR